MRLKMAIIDLMKTPFKIEERADVAAVLYDVGLAQIDRATWSSVFPTMLKQWHRLYLDRQQQ